MTSSPLVLLIGGPSSVGKSTVARELGRACGIPWLAVDDLRLALQALVPAGSNEPDAHVLHYFEATPNVWRRPLAELRDAFIAIGRLLVPAVRMIIRNHLAIGEPIIIEGDGLLPDIVADPVLAQARDAGQLRAVFLVTGQPDLIRTQMVQRGWAAGLVPADLERCVAAKQAYGQWLATEAVRLDVPVLDPEPLATLPERLAPVIARTAH